MVDLDEQDIAGTQPASLATSLEGKFLVAMPTLKGPFFERSVVYLCSHSDDGAMGLVVNQISTQITFPDLLRQVDILSDDDQSINLPAPARNMQVLNGGPVDQGRGFVLHSADFKLESSTLDVSDDICLTATIEILRALAEGKGPQSALLTLGYAGWSPGQLEEELQSNSWLTCSADQSLLFECEAEDRYQRSLDLMGIDLTMLSSEAGHA
ncbi:YqgE/AlgH family protein [Cohaesibacter sp. CAU 1516]|uniref:YqgE/AlgH family protein n=1 Tax=Cohaesibacter sp. CAU 1516 TaxID=2576038 RepID=UPI0010FED0C6|nr:YqgE/AlgH family protein [Cohaesibacter sp. CAU 1516]TLP45649.1 YqgE/AlgH family protein [Cohaesibacter sp. CAU 1516]